MHINMHLSSGLAKGEKNISLDMPGLILKLKDRRGWSYQELAAQLGVSAATVEKYIARVPQYLAVKLADTAGKYGERDLELKFRAYAEGQTTEQEQEKKVPFDFEALSPDAKKIAQIAAEIYTDPTPGEPFEEHFGEFILRLQDLRVRNQFQRQQKKKAGKKTAG